MTTYKTRNKKDLKDIGVELDGINELIAVNARLAGYFEYKRDEHLVVEFLNKEFNEPEEVSAALSELFDAEDTKCLMNNYPVPVEYALLPNNSERFFYQLNADKKGYQNWQIYGMRKAIGFDSLIGILS